MFIRSLYGRICLLSLLHYIYFILRYAPDIDIINKELIQYKKKGYFKNILMNLNKYFGGKSSQSCIMVEKENGPDEYVDDLRELF
jgi:hypothetical protein